MKAKIIVAIIFLGTGLIFAQDYKQDAPPPPQYNRGEGFQNFKNKLEELEKLKIIDALHMDEKTTLRFFARRDEHKTKIKNYREEQKRLLDEMYNGIQKDSLNNAQLNEKIKEYLNIDDQIEKEQVRFINSLSDILTTKQISQLLIFQNKWMQDIRDLLLRHRPRDRGRN